MKAQLIKGALAALLAAAAAYFRALLPSALVLALVMASDYVTGVLAAYRAGELSSRTGLLGICKKLGYLFCVGVAVTVDFTVRAAGAQLGLDLGGFCAFGLLVTVWLILNECLSILENLTELGVPVPGFLRTVVERLKKSAEGRGEEKGETPQSLSLPQRGRVAPQGRVREICASPLPAAEEGEAQITQPRHWRAESEAGPGMADAARRSADSEDAPSPSSAFRLAGDGESHLPPLGEGISPAPAGRPWPDPGAPQSAPVGRPWPDPGAPQSPTDKEAP